MKKESIFREEGCALDIEILTKYLAPLQTRSDNPAVMCVGAVSLVEANSIRKFYDRVHAQRVKVAGCNNGWHIPSHRDSFDYFAYGVQGNACLSSPFEQAKNYLGADGFDMIMIRNPLMISTDKMEDLFTRALGYLLPQSHLVTLVDQGDVDDFERLIDRLAVSKVAPIVNTTTGLKAEHHTIGIFPYRE